MSDDAKISKCPNTGSVKFSRNHYSIEFTTANKERRHLVVISDAKTRTRSYVHIDRAELINLAQTLLNDPDFKITTA